MDAIEDPPDATASHPAPWSLILIAGAAGWAVVTTTAILWMHPMSGKIVGNQYYLTSPARAFQHLLVFAISLVAYRIAFWRHAPRYRRAPLAFLGLHLLLALLVVRLAPFAAGLASGLIDQRGQDLRDTVNYWVPFHPELIDWLTPMQFFLPPYLLGLALIAMVQLARDYHRESLRSTRLWAAYAEARLAMLSAQLQPHFLFNALHAIAELINDSPERATVMLARLGDFLRHALESSKQAWVSVTVEIAGLEAYLAVQQARFSDRLSVSISVDPAAATLALPSLLLQPLVENAVEHGRGGPSSRLAVSIAATASGDRLRIAIRNSTPQLSQPLTSAAYGTGLNNVDSRLRAAYGAAASLAIGPDPQGGTLATLDIPARQQT